LFDVSRAFVLLSNSRLVTIFNPACGRRRVAALAPARLAPGRRCRDFSLRRRSDEDGRGSPERSGFEAADDRPELMALLNLRYALTLTGNEDFIAWRLYVRRRLSAPALVPVDCEVASGPAANSCELGALK
jgi:hypothetical protein